MRFQFIDESKWDQNDKDLFHLLILDKPFISLIQKARLDMGTKEGKLPTNFKTAKIYKTSKKYSDEILELYDLHRAWFHPICFFIATGKVPSPGNGVSLSIPSREFSHMRPEPVKIIISEKVSLNKLLQFIQENKGRIRELLEELPRERRGVKDLELRKEIKKLFNQGLTVKEISDRLVNYDDLDLQKVRNYIKRNRQLLQGSKIT